MRRRNISRAVPIVLALAAIACVALLPVSASALEPLSLQVDAHIGATRTYAWTIEKSVDVASFDLLPGQTATPRYTVTATKDGGTDSDFRLAGTVTLINPTASTATITGLTISVIGGNPVNVSGLTFPLVLAPGAQAIATFSEPMPDASSQLLLVNATTTGPVPGDSALANAVYEGPTSLVNDAIVVDDSLAGTLGTLTDTGSFTYSLEFGYGDAGTHTNVATILSTGQQAGATVRINAIEPSSAADDMRDLVDFLDAAVKRGDLAGFGPGKSAPHRMNALRNMLVEAGRLLDEGSSAAARAQLRDVLVHCDGKGNPADFVAGDARQALATKVLALLARLAD